MKKLHVRNRHLGEYDICMCLVPFPESGKHVLPEVALRSKYHLPRGRFSQNTLPAYLFSGFMQHHRRWPRGVAIVGDGEGEGEGDIDVIVNTTRNKQDYLLYIAYRLPIDYP